MNAFANQLENLIIQHIGVVNEEISIEEKVTVANLISKINDGKISMHDIQDQINNMQPITQSAVTSALVYIEDAEDQQQICDYIASATTRSISTIDESTFHKMVEDQIPQVRKNRHKQHQEKINQMQAEYELIVKENQKLKQESEYNDQENELTNQVLSQQLTIKQLQEKIRDQKQEIKEKTEKIEKQDVEIDNKECKIKQLEKENKKGFFAGIFSKIGSTIGKFIDMIINSIKYIFKMIF